MFVAVPLSLAAVLAFALAVCIVALRRAAARATDAEARLGAVAERAQAAQTALRDLRAMPLLDVPPVSDEPRAEPATLPDAARRSPSDARRGSRRAPRPLRPASDPSPSARP